MNQEQHERKYDQIEKLINHWYNCFDVEPILVSNIWHYLNDTIGAGRLTSIVVAKERGNIYKLIYWEKKNLQQFPKNNKNFNKPRQQHELYTVSIDTEPGYLYGSDQIQNMLLHFSW